MIRLRVGDWRVIMDDGVVLEIVAIGSRGSVYG
jgi:mRNA interferase RelE/StbE